MNPSTPHNTKYPLRLVCAVACVGLVGCNSAQFQQVVKSAAPLVGAGLGIVIGNQSGNKATGAIVGALIAKLAVDLIESSQRQREQAVSRGRYAYNNDAQFSRRFKESKKAGNVKYVAVRVPKDESKPDSKAGFMLYDPDRGGLVNKTVYAAGSKSSGNTYEIDGKRAMIYSGAM